VSRGIASEPTNDNIHAVSSIGSWKSRRLPWSSHKAGKKVVAACCDEISKMSLQRRNEVRLGEGKIRLVKIADKQYKNKIELAE
jgi:hypothetical protein